MELRPPIETTEEEETTATIDVPVLEIPVSKVYIQVNSDGLITACEGGYTAPKDLTGWIQIDEGVGDEYNLCQSHYFEGGIRTRDGIPRYKYVDGVCVLRADDEVSADLEAQMAAIALTPSQLDRVEAQVTYTALMTDTLLEED